jgi:hypothetical protein
MADSLNLVGLGRLELPTSPLSGVRSSHLSYRPVCPNFITTNPGAQTTTPSFQLPTPAKPEGLAKS